MKIIPKQEVLLTIVLVLYAIVIGAGLYHHELWGDELQSWNLAKGSDSFLDLFSTIKYEGHPPLWHILLWSMTKFTHTPESMKILHFFIALALGGVILFLSPFPVSLRVIIISGYYFVFEYAVISRNYGIGAFMAFLTVWVMLKEEFRYKHTVYYILLFLTANVHLLSCLLAISIHAGYLLRSSFPKLKLVSVLTFCIFLPTLYFIFPPSDSGSGFWINTWQFKQMFIFLLVPIKSFLSVPAWWEYHFWDSNILIDSQKWLAAWRYLFIAFFSFLILATVIYLTFNNYKSRYLIFVSIFLTYVANVMTPLISMRYAGFFYISFLCAMWIVYSENKDSLSGVRRYVFLFLLILQLPRGVYTLYKDYKLPFSCASEVVELNKQIPSGAHVVSTYWCINNLSAYLDRPFHCLETKQEERFIKWDSNLKTFLTESYPYTTGLNAYFEQHACKEVYLFSTIPYEGIVKKDAVLLRQYQFQLIEKIQGAIEPSGDQYLYIVTPL